MKYSKTTTGQFKPATMPTQQAHHPFSIGLPRLPKNLSDRLVLSDQHTHHFVLFNDLIRVEGSGSYSTFVLSNSERVTTSRRLNIYKACLENQGFIKTHQSHLANATHITKFQRSAGGALVMSNGDLVPISHGFQKQVQRALGLSST